MSFYLKLGLFWIAAVIALRLLARFPDSQLSRLAYTWYGPVPFVGELRSGYLWRWCRCALIWLTQILVLILCGLVALRFNPKLIEFGIFHATFLFALPILAGMALLGAAIAGLASWKARFLGPNPAFRNDTQGHAV